MSWIGCLPDITDSPRMKSKQGSWAKDASWAERIQCSSPKRALPPTQPEEVSVLTSLLEHHKVLGLVYNLCLYCMSKSLLAHFFNYASVHFCSSDALIQSNFGIWGENTFCCLTKRLLWCQERIVYWKFLSDRQALRGCLLGRNLLRVNLFLVDWTSQLHNLF